MFITWLPTRELTQPQDMVYVVYPHLNNPAHTLSNCQKVVITFVDVNSFSLLISLVNTCLRDGQLETEPSSEQN